MLAVVLGDRPTRHPRFAFGLSLGLWKWYNVPCTSFTVRNGRSTLPLELAAVCRSSAFGGRWVRTRTPRLPITDWNTRDRLTKSDERRVGNGGVRSVRSRCATSYYKKNTRTNTMTARNIQ